VQERDRLEEGNGREYREEYTFNFSKRTANLFAGRDAHLYTQLPFPSCAGRTI